MEAGKGDGPPPPELRLLWRIDRYHALPEAGGLNDQPAGLLDRLTILGNVYTAFKSLHTTNDIVTFAKNSPDMMKIVSTVLELERDGTE
jgi:hypothetical protein